MLALLRNIASNLGGGKLSSTMLVIRARVAHETVLLLRDSDIDVRQIVQRVFVVCRGNKKRRGIEVDLTRDGIVPSENSVQPIAAVIPSNRTANLEQFAAPLESGEPNSPMHACATEHSSDMDFKAPRIGTAQPRVDSGSFRKPAVRSGGAAHQPAVAPRRTPFPAAESLVAPASLSPTKDVFSIDGSNRNTN